jgi:hypothetical protein
MEKKLTFIKMIEEITAKLMPKMLVPFRSGDHRDKTKDIIGDGIYDYIKYTVKDAVESEREKFNGYIPAPTKDFVNRLRFLFTGKFK